MPTVAAPIRLTVVTNAPLRPSLSPTQPNTSDPRGRKAKPAPNAPSARMKPAASGTPEKKFFEIRAARLPKTKKSYHSKDVPAEDAATMAPIPAALSSAAAVLLFEAASKPVPLLFRDKAQVLRAHALDRAHALVAGADPAGVRAVDVGTRRRAVGDQVARMQGHDAGPVGQVLPDVVFHAAGVGVLLGLAVQFEVMAGVHRVLEEFLGRDERPDRGEGVVVLLHEPVRPAAHLAVAAPLAVRGVEFDGV